MNKKIFVIILNYNGRDTLERCLRSVFRSQNVNFTVVVVDNASEDGSFEEVRKNWPRVNLIRNDKNLGFAAGNNVGIRFALERDADYVFLLNNDAEILPDTLERLLEAAERNRRPSVLCPLIETPKGKIWYAGSKINWWRMRTEHVNLVSDKNSDTIVPVEVATGCAVLIAKEVFAKIGLLNESYFLYYEDADFSFCARKSGFTVGLLPSSRAVHAETSELPDKKGVKTYWLVLSGLLFFRTYAPWYWRYLWYPLFVFLRRQRNRRNLRRKLPNANRVAQAYKDYAYAKKHFTPHC